MTAYKNFSSSWLLQARAGHIPTIDALKVGLEFKAETNYTVWADLTSNLKVIGNVVKYTDYNDLFKKYSLDLYGCVAEKVGWEKRNDESKSCGTRGPDPILTHRRVHLPYRS